MTNRSHHMPTLMRMEAIHITYTLVRPHFDQKMFGRITLQNTISQKIGMYGSCAAEA